MIKCIVCDLDGTLLQNGYTIEKQTVELLKKYISEGVRFVVATGRDYSIASSIMKTYSLKADYILCNGTRYRNASGTIDEFYPMRAEDFLLICDLLLKKDYSLTIHTTKGRYGLKNEEVFWNHYLKMFAVSGLNYTEEQIAMQKERQLKDLYFVDEPIDLVKQGIKVLKIDARHVDSANIQQVRTQVNIPGLFIGSSFAYNVEITEKSANKANLLKDLMRKYGFKKSEVAVFGDGENDIGMLSLVDYSFAPQNADDEVKQIAFHTLEKTNIQGAVGEGIVFLQESGVL